MCSPYHYHNSGCVVGSGGRISLLKREVHPIVSRGAYIIRIVAVAPTNNHMQSLISTCVCIRTFGCPRALFVSCRRPLAQLNRRLLATAWSVSCYLYLVSCVIIMSKITDFVASDAIYR